MMGRLSLHEVHAHGIHLDPCDVGVVDFPGPHLGLSEFGGAGFCPASEAQCCGRFCD